jgi:hypothetical protein
MTTNEKGKITDTADIHTSNARIYGYSILVGSGAGCYVVAGFPVVQSLVAPKDIPNAVGAMAICKRISDTNGALLNPNNRYTNHKF